MQFVDTVLIRVADPATRASVFDQISLEQIISAGYDTTALNLQGPFSPVFDDLQLGFSAPRLGLVEGSWAGLGGAGLNQARFQLSGLTGAAERAEAWWRGGVVGRMATPASPVMEVKTSFPSLGTLDAEIVAALGALPADPIVLERERRNRLRTRLQAAFKDHTAFREVDLNNWLEQVGAESVSDLLGRFQGSIQPGGVSVTFAPIGPVPVSPRLFPLSAAILVRDNTLSIAKTLGESRALIEQVQTVGLEVVPIPGLPSLRPLMVLWIVPDTLFDDSGWPGASQGMTPTARRAARRAQAGKWLAREGIGLVVVSA